MKGRLPASILNAAHLPKPQLSFLTLPDNARGAAFSPTITAKSNAIVPLDLTPTNISDDEDSIPKIPNPYKHELSLILDNLPQDTLNIAPEPPSAHASDSFDKIPFEYIDTLPRFQALVAELNTAKAIAVDLEHHDYRTYTGIVCLIQISIENKDYVVDPLVPAIRANLTLLNESFTNPKIVKVFHGAESDVIWLQRDCGVYVVGLFDTYHASKALSACSSI